MRTVLYQLEITEAHLIATLEKLQTSLNSYKQKKGYTEYLRLVHVQDDALSVVMAIERYSILQLMRDSEEVDK